MAKPAKISAAQLERARRYRLEILRSVCTESFRDYVTHLWPQIEPTRALVSSVAVDGVCAALQAVGDGRIKRLVICQPPGTGKSLLDAVAFPSWLELRSQGRERVMCGSYSHRFAERDAIKCREVIRSAAYRALTGGTWGIRSDVGDRYDDVWFTGGGRRVIVSPATSMGERCTVQIIDDALSGADVYSETERRKATRWVAEALPSRLEDQEKDARVLSGQRLCEDDPPGWAIRAGWKLLNLPAVLEQGEAPCELYDDAGVLVWRDERAPGVPLSELLSVAALARLRADMGSVAFSAQYLQRPRPAGGGMFKREWFTRRWGDLPDHFDRKVVALDATFKAGDASDYAVIQCWGARGGDRLLIEQWRRQAGFAETLAALAAMAGRHPLAKVVVELAANGHAIVEQLRRDVPGVVGVKPVGSKAARAASVQAIAESGAIVLPTHAPWVEDFVDEVSAFTPQGSSSLHDDQLDAMVWALRELALAHDDVPAASGFRITA